MKLTPWAMSVTMTMTITMTMTYLKTGGSLTVTAAW